MNRSRILILMSATGGGHRASAQALQAAFAARYPDRFQVEVVDPWTDYTPWPINRIPRTYSPIVARALWFWKLLWLVFENERALSAVLRLAYLLCRNELRKVLRDYRPHLIISVHPLIQHIFLRLLEQERAPIPFVTVVTDLASFHHGWFHARAERCYVASEAAADAARRHGLPARKVRLLGLPVRSAFTDALPEQSDRARPAGAARQRLYRAPARRGEAWARSRDWAGGGPPAGGEGDGRATWSSSAAAISVCAKRCSGLNGRFRCRCAVLSITCRNGWLPATALSPRPGRAQSPRR